MKKHLQVVGDIYMMDVLSDVQTHSIKELK